MKKNSKQINFINDESLSAYTAYTYKSFMDKYRFAFQDENKIGFVPVFGALGHGFWNVDWKATDYQSIQENIASYERNENVNHIVLLINSPGGAVSGLFTLCDYIASVDKPITAFITSEACSAAYAIATACDSIYMERDAVTGCCGCYAEAYEYKEENLVSKIFRSAISPKKNLSVFDNKEAEKEYQARIDSLGEEYLRYVSNNRGVDYEKALSSFGQGLVVDSGFALENEMVDGIATFHEVLSSILSVKNDTENNSSLSAKDDESEGEIYMTKDDIAKMTSEQRAELFGNLCAVDSSLLSATRESEKQRIMALNDLRDGSASINAIVDNAIAEGKVDSDVALEILKATRENAVSEEASRKQVLEQMVTATTVTATPTAEFDEESFMAEVMKQVKEIR